MNQFTFSLLRQDDSARLGRLQTPHGIVDTPAFIPVGTQAAVKATRPSDLLAIGTQMVMCNTYHLYLRPGGEVISKIGGLHRFMNWEGPLMVDSGGFQVMSLGAGIEHGVGKQVDLFADDSRVESWLNRKPEKPALVPKEKFCVVTDERIIFKSHLDGTLHEWNPEKSVAVQRQLGADLIFALDECTSPLHNREYTQDSLRRSHAWEERSLAAVANTNQAMYGIVQGGPYEDLRRQSARFVDGMDFFGMGIGGALINKTMMRSILTWIAQEAGGDKPVHLLGIGSIDDILTGVGLGVDTFDCADPTRIARHGHVLLSPDDGGNSGNRWRLNLASPSWRDDSSPIGRTCLCPVCQAGFTRAYINHLLWAAELTAATLTTIHNLSVMQLLMQEIRDGIGRGKFRKIYHRWMG